MRYLSEVVFNQHAETIKEEITMKRILTLIPAIAVVSSCLFACLSGLKAQDQWIENWQINPDKELNPNTTWLREAKWGLFAHYMAHQASAPIPEDMNSRKWNKKVNSFQVKKFADQLEQLKVPYFFITIGQAEDYFCSPNETYEKLFGPSDGRLSKRDLVAELGKELTSRGIRLCVYLPAKGRSDPPEIQAKWRLVIREWSMRWGRNVSAWWIDGAKFNSPEVFKAYTEAFKSGNPNALVAYNGGPVGMNRRQLLPVTQYEDFLAGEVGYILPACGTIPESLLKRKVYSICETTDYYQGPNIYGDQLHFLTFMGSFWGVGDPRFPDAYVIGWTQHVNDHGGVVTWDLRLQDNGIMPESFYKQVEALSKAIDAK